MNKKGFIKELESNGYSLQFENQYTKKASNPFHTLIVSIKEDEKSFIFYGVSLSHSYSDSIGGTFDEVLTQAQDKGTTLMGYLESEMKDKMIKYLTNYELIHKLYKIAKKSDLYAVRSGMELDIRVSHNNKKYELKFHSYADYILTTITNNETGEKFLKKVTLQELSENCQCIEEILNVAMGIDRWELDLFKRLPDDSES